MPQLNEKQKYAVGQIGSNPRRYAALLAELEGALEGDSNDDEHDALISVYEFLTGEEAPSQS